MMPEKPRIEGCFAFNGGDFADAGQAAIELKARLAALGVPAQTVRRAAVSAFEAEMNVIIHARAGSMYYVIRGGELLITVTDTGPGIADVELAMQEGYSTAPKWARDVGWGSGMGLPNIKNNSDALKIDSIVGEGTTLLITIKLGAEGQNENC
ncbi:MAG: ATP-binding protein [Actinomycetota bacterium]|nr:ATP-binding protein [Actinomycetota bacterium]